MDKGADVVNLLFNCYILPESCGQLLYRYDKCHAKIDLFHVKTLANFSVFKCMKDLGPL